jgi:hypothetical protein
LKYLTGVQGPFVPNVSEGELILSGCPCWGSLRGQSPLKGNKFRSLAITLLHILGYENMAEGIEVLAKNKQAALRIVRFGRTE